eukprot:scaffold23481_cov203-Cylindrotheca_fusiformis.AAC.1
MQKAAIYSVDIHGDKIATGGGDGKVRLWNIHALFHQVDTATTTTTTQNQRRRRRSRPSQFREGGVYESSGESSSSSSSEESGAAAGGSLSSANANVSNDMDVDNNDDDDNRIHDLNNVVRRKKDGGSPSKLPMPATTTTSSATTTTNTTAKTNPHKPGIPFHNHHHRHHDRLLCTLSAHTGSSVLAVRFSNSGQYLASAGDDAAVCIYTKSNTGGGGGGGGNLESSVVVEHWNRIKLCRGHALDAVGLAWAPDDSHLVSCSLDSNTPIIVWKLTDLATNNTNSQNRGPTHYSNVLCNPYKVLGKGMHTSTVKGVTFDPAGTYLASSGDDPSVCIWRAHDDWGLERRIDASSGIFRRWKENNEAQSFLSSQSLFRRLSWSTDGAYICSTNAVVKNKHVASTISREGWAVSNSKSTASGAANLVGHKQPVVVCRHCPLLLDARPTTTAGDSEAGNHDDDEEPEYGNLLALGDKRGFVTVWSTRKSRPVFKIQCSESRCTVTDLAWGRVDNKDVVLIVSLLDGQVVALRFSVPDELGKMLNAKAQARVFQMRYGIDINDQTDVGGGRRLFVGENSGPKLIENALQFSLENQDDDPDENGDSNDDENDNDMSEDEEDPTTNTSNELKETQTVSRSKSGKKRIQPLLMSNSNGGDASSKKARLSNGSASKKDKSAKKKKADTLDDAMEMAEKAASGAEAAATTQLATTENNASSTASAEPSSPSQRGPRQLSGSSNGHHHHGSNLAQGVQLASTPQIPHSTNRVHSIELPIEGGEVPLVADCTNSIQIPQGSTGSALPCAVLSISKAGQKMWSDQFPGASCSTIAASKNLLAMGTADGCVQLFGTSPTLGWSSGLAFRSHPPLVFGGPIVMMQLHEVSAPTSGNAVQRTDMLVVSADGSFGVYTVFPELKIRYKGTIMPPMTHMLLASDLSTEIHLPRLARLQLTDKNQLLLLLSLHSSQGRSMAEDNGNNSSPSVGPGGSLQAFVYSTVSELWMRVADSRFVLSDFYSSLPLSSKSKKPRGELSKLDDAVRMGATSGTLKAGRRGRLS